MLTEARMACNAEESHQMLEASQRHPELVAQIVPSPMGFTGMRTVRRMLSEGYIGRLREVVVLSVSDGLADATAPLHWRQSAEYSGLNMLSLGIVHEATTRWIPQPTRVMAQTQAFITHRKNGEEDGTVAVGTPDSVQVLTELPGRRTGIVSREWGIVFWPR